MNFTELDTFVFKFKKIWKSGLSGHRNLESHDGQSLVGLRVRLGYAPGPFHHRSGTRDGPSRYYY